MPLDTNLQKVLAALPELSAYEKFFTDVTTGSQDFRNRLRCWVFGWYRICGADVPVAARPLPGYSVRGAKGLRTYYRLVMLVSCKRGAVLRDLPGVLDVRSSKLGRGFVSACDTRPPEAAHRVLAGKLLGAGEWVFSPLFTFPGGLSLVDLPTAHRLYDKETSEQA